MNSFSDFNIKPDLPAYTGDKIKIEKVLNVPIVVHSYKIEDSKFKEKGNGKRLCLQITHNDEQRIIFTNSIVLQNMIQKVDTDKFPFKATIIKESERYEFR